MEKSLKSIFFKHVALFGSKCPVRKIFFYASSPGSNWFVHETSRLSQQFFSLVRMCLISNVVSCSRTQHDEACGDRTQDLFI